MKHKKSVLKILSANSECFRVSAGIAPNVSRLEAVANFGNINFPLLLNFLRKINVIEPHILPLLQTDVSTSILNKLLWNLEI